MLKRGKEIYDSILKLVSDVRKKENALEKKVEEIDEENALLYKAIDSMISTSRDHYKVLCEYRKEGYSVPRCTRPPKELGLHTFDPSCRYQWLHYGNIVCVNMNQKYTEKKK